MNTASHNGQEYDLTRRIKTDWSGLGKTNDVRDMAAAEDKSGKSHMAYSMGEINRKTRNMLRHQYTNYDVIIPQDRYAAPEVQAFRNVVKREINRMMFERWPGLDNDSDTRWIQPLVVNGADNAPKMKALDYDAARGDHLAALTAKTRGLAESLIRAESVDDFLALREMLRGFDDIAAMAKELGFREKKPAIEPARETQPPAAVSDEDVIYLGKKSIAEAMSIITTYRELGQLGKVAEKTGYSRPGLEYFLKKNNIDFKPYRAIDPDTGKEMYIGHCTIPQVKDFYRNLDKMGIDDAATVLGISMPTAYRLRKMRYECPN